MLHINAFYIDSILSVILAFILKIGNFYTYNDWKLNPATYKKFSIKYAFKSPNAIYRIRSEEREILALS